MLNVWFIHTLRIEPMTPSLRHQLSYRKSIKLVFIYTLIHIQFTNGSFFLDLVYKTRIKEKWWLSPCGRTWLVCRKLWCDFKPWARNSSPHIKTYGYSHYRHCCNRDGNTIFECMNYVFIFVATVLEVSLSVPEKRVPQCFLSYRVSIEVTVSQLYSSYGKTRSAFTREECLLTKPRV